MRFLVYHQDLVRNWNGFLGKAEYTERNLLEQVRELVRSYGVGIRTYAH